VVINSRVQCKKGDGKDFQGKKLIFNWSLYAQMKLENHNFDEEQSKSGPFYIGLFQIINSRRG
jgi:hypothetical protein